MPVNNPYLSGDTTDFPESDVSVRQLFTTGAIQSGGAFNSASALSVGAITATTFGSRSALSAGDITGVLFSSNTIDFFSVLTAANTSGMTRGELRIVQAASGFSLMFSSGATSYTIGASAVSAAQA